MGISDHVLIVVNLWGRLTLGNPTGSGFWHSSNGILDPAASHGAPGQLPFGGSPDILWGAPAGDVQLSTNPLGTFTVVGLRNAPVPALAAGILTCDGTNLSWGAGGPFSTLVALTAPIAAASLASGTRYLVDSSGGAFTQALPALSSVPLGFRVGFTDDTNSWTTHGFTVAANGADAMVDPRFVGNGGAMATGSPASVTLGPNGEARETYWFTKVGTKWDVT